MFKQAIITDLNPFNNYFSDTNPQFQNVIDKHYYKTYELLLDNGKSILLNEFRKKQGRQAR